MKEYTYEWLIKNLYYGDLLRIREIVKKENGDKYTSTYISNVCHGQRKNDRILNKAIEIAENNEKNRPKIR